ncbi:MAG: hypothetical protein LBH35_04445 [Treponema sp.]|jgi:hypothetical protein|nr:hypothetical protein [Treponema sp.]
MIGKCFAKPAVLLFACCVVWALGACKQLPEKTGEYPVSELPPAPPDEAPEAVSDEPPVDQTAGAETGEEASAVEAADEAPEVVVPEPVPRRITGLPRLAEVPEIPVERDTEDEAPPEPVQPEPVQPEPVLPEPVQPEPVQVEPVPPAARAEDAPRPPPETRTPPPVPEFIRPSQPAVPEKRAEEPPPEPVFALPARPSPPPDDDIVYSRIVTAYVGQYVEIPFRGPGWVYLGELGSRRGVYYDSRRIDDDGMVFVFRANEEGSYSLKFNQQDFIRDYVINDYVQVKVLPPPELTGSVWHSTAVVPDRVYAAPRWPPADAPPGTSGGTNPARPAPETPGAAPEAATPPEAAPVTPAAAPRPTARPEPETRPAAQEAVQAAPGTQPDADWAPGPAWPEEAPPEAFDAAEPPALPDTYLAKAKEEYDAGRIAGALEALDRFRAAYPGGSDEAYWLYGQALEASGPNRDIRRALDYYRRLTREYPQSSRYDAARRRIAYLERYYFNIQ